MPHQAAAPVEADALRPLARAITHAQVPAALKLLLLALLAAFSLANPARRARRPWHPSPDSETTADLDSALQSRALHAILRLRAWIGWLMCRARARGMSLSGQRALAPCPSQVARAPPWRARARHHHESVAKTPHPAATTHAQSPSRGPDVPVLCGTSSAPLSPPADRDASAPPWSADAR